MSENISLPAARVPKVDGDGMITREWLTLLSGLFRRVGGPVGFSNSELYGDAVALQSYDELLERISSLEAQNRNLGQVVQMMALGGWDQMTATPPLGLRYLVGPRDEARALTGIPGRCKRAAENSVTALALFAPAVLMLQAKGALERVHSTFTHACDVQTRVGRHPVDVVERQTGVGDRRLARLDRQ